MPDNEQSTWIIERLTAHHNRADFSCGKTPLDQYLKILANQDARRGIAVPFVAVLKTAPRTIIGYYTLSSYAVDIGDLPPEIMRKLPRHRLIPATMLGRLAVDSRYHGKRLGEHLLMDALRLALVQSSQVASYAVVVDAIDDEAMRFYEHFEFLSFPTIRNRLFLPMQIIARLFR